MAPAGTSPDATIRCGSAPPRTRAAAAPPETRRTVSTRSREFRNPVSVITKNELVTRDADLLEQLASHRAASVNVSITTLDPDLHRTLEPRTATPARRLEAVRALASRGIPVNVLIAPVIPALTDHEIPRLVEAAAATGASECGYILLRLPGVVAPLFESWLERHFPDRKEKVLNRVRSLRGGRLNDPRFGSRMRGEGVFAEEIEYLHRMARQKAGFPGMPRLETRAFRRPGRAQELSLFEEDEVE